MLLPGNSVPAPNFRRGTPVAAALWAAQRELGPHLRKPNLEFGNNSSKWRARESLRYYQMFRAEPPGDAPASRLLEIEKHRSEGSTLEKKDTTLEKKEAALDKIETTHDLKCITLGLKCITLGLNHITLDLKLITLGLNHIAHALNHITLALNHIALAPNHITLAPNHITLALKYVALRQKETALGLKCVQDIAHIPY